MVLLEVLTDVEWSMDLSGSRISHVMSRKDIGSPLPGEAGAISTWGREPLSRQEEPA